MERSAKIAAIATREMVLKVPQGLNAGDDGRQRIHAGVPRGALACSSVGSHPRSMQRGVAGTQDFAMESDENKMRKAAHLMVQSLASSLALVAYKDPLRAR